MEADGHTGGEREMEGAVRLPGVCEDVPWRASVGAGLGGESPSMLSAPGAGAGSAAPVIHEKGRASAPDSWNIPGELTE